MLKKRIKESAMKKIDKKTLCFSLVQITFSLIYVILGCLPNAISMNFFGGFVEYHPYFSMFPYGYGNIFALYMEICAMITIVFTIVAIFVNKKFFHYAPTFLAFIILIFNGVELVFSATAINFAMLGISIAHAICALAIAIINKRTDKQAKVQTASVEKTQDEQ